MKLLRITLLMVMVSSVLLAQNVTVTLQVNMKVKAKETLFDPKVDSITVHGDFMTDAGLGSNWFPVGVTMQDLKKDSVYSTTLTIPTTHAGTLYHYKFTISDRAWEGDPNREFTLGSTDMTIPAVWFDRDSIVTLPVTNTLNFTADLTKIYGTGRGYFDPSIDSLLLMGLDWVGATVVGGNRKFAEDPFRPGTFHAQMVIKGFKGDSTKWKTKAYPDARYANTGWEVTSDRWYTIKDEGTTTTVPTFVPSVFPMKDSTTKDVTVLYQVSLVGATNRYTDRAIDISKIFYVGIKGQHSRLGAWGGDWTAADTASTPKTLLVLNDKGLNGDKVAGDNIWSITVVFPRNDPGGPSLYKYGAYYPGSDTLNSGFHAGDNEMKENVNHFFNLLDVPRIEILDAWGKEFSVSVTGVKNAVAPTQFTVSQNYPNPFNPATKIRYSLPTSSVVTLRLFNVIGQEVATVINAQQAAGTYDIILDGSKLSTGVYFYRLEAGSHSVTKRMVLLK